MSNAEVCQHKAATGPGEVSTTCSICSRNSPRLAHAAAFAAGERIAQVFAGLLGERQQALHNFRMLGGDVGSFPDILLQIVKLRIGDFGRLISGRNSDRKSVV